MVHRSGGGADRNLAVVIADYLQGGSASGWAPPTMPRWTSVQVHSPLLPLVMDAQGRRAGVDARTGQVYDEIPHAIITPGHPWELAIPAEAGRLAVTYTTAYPFPFGIDVIGIAAGVETSRQSFEGTATESYMASQSVDVVLTPDGVQVTASSLGGGQDEGRRVFLPLVRH
jgi:hypothetical protein